jgi:hypothetical protein
LLQRFDSIKVAFFVFLALQIQQIQGVKWLNSVMLFCKKEAI